MDRTTAWALIGAERAYALRASDAPACPYGAVVVASDFGTLAEEDIDHLCIWLVATGCKYGAFLGRGSQTVENVFDQMGVLVTLALEGDEGSLHVLAPVWSSDLAQAARDPARNYATLVSTSHNPDSGPLDELFDEFTTWNALAFEHGIVVALDPTSESMTRKTILDMGLRAFEMSSS